MRPKFLHEGYLHPRFEVPTMVHHPEIKWPHSGCLAKLLQNVPCDCGTQQVAANTEGWRPLRCSLEPQLQATSTLTQGSLWELQPLASGLFLRNPCQPRISTTGGTDSRARPHNDWKQWKQRCAVQKSALIYLFSSHLLLTVLIYFSINCKDATDIFWFRETYNKIPYF